MLWFNYDLFLISFFQIRGANLREEFVSEAEPDGDQANRDMYSFNLPALLQTKSSTSTLAVPTSMTSVFNDVFLTVLPFLKAHNFLKPCL